MTTLPFATKSMDTVVYGCKDVSLCVCSYVRSAVKISTVVSPRDKARTDIANPGGWLSLIIFPIPYRAIGCLTLRVSREANPSHEGERECHKEARLRVLIQVQVHRNNKRVNSVNNS